MKFWQQQQSSPYHRMLEQRQNQRDQRLQQLRHQGHQQKLKSWHGDHPCHRHPCHRHTCHHHPCHHHPCHHNLCLHRHHRHPFRHTCDPYHPTSSFHPLPHHHAHLRPCLRGSVCWTSSEACPLRIKKVIRLASTKREN